MNELIQKLVSNADLSQAQAEKAANVVRDFLSEKLPEAVRGPVMSALTGQNVDSAADMAKNAIGKLFG